MSQRACRQLYFANFESSLRYGIIFWGQMQNIFVTQKRVIRIINKMGYHETCRTVFKKMRILTAYALYIYECLVFFIRNKPLFNLVAKTSMRSLNVNYPQPRLAVTETCPYYMCIKLCNILPDKFKLIQSEKLFKREIKEMLINLEPYCLKDFNNKAISILL